jgi:hypothetical protein
MNFCVLLKHPTGQDAEIVANEILHMNLPFVIMWMFFLELPFQVGQLKRKLRRTEFNNVLRTMIASMLS